MSKNVDFGTRVDDEDFQARSSRFCMEVDLDNTYNKMMMILMMIIIMMMIAVTQLIFRLRPPDFAWKEIWFIPATL